MGYGNKEITSEKVKHYAVLEDRNEWQLEFNLVSWNGAEPKYDIRPWKKDGSRCGTGITLSTDNLKALVQYCNDNRLHEI